jgi:hypothetical protein
MPRNEKNIEEQRFDALQNININIRAKIENTVALLNHLLTPLSKQYNLLKRNRQLSPYNFNTRLNQ